MGGSKMETFDWLSKGYSPLPVDPDSVQVLQTPSDYYEKLLHGIKTAKNRIILSTLYLGTGILEQVDNINEAVKNNPEIRVGILLDYLRGTRGGASSSRALLTPLADDSEIYFYHTPDLRGFKKSVLSERANEIVGVQHMKFYIFDDSILISGANLSDLYFTHRQDRYIFIENCPELANFFTEIFNAVALHSFKLDAYGNLRLNSKCQIDPINGNDVDFRSSFRTKIYEVLENLEKRSKILLAKSSSNTLVYPFLQSGTYDIRDEEKILMRLFSHSDSEFSLTMASGYFNLFDNYMETILHKTSYPMDIIFASPQANGFYNGHGFSGYVPSLYVYVSELFYKQAKYFEKDITLYEYIRPGWTFHAKGIWFESKNSKSMATIFGSSNFGYRAVNRDLEAQVLLITSDEVLKEKLSTEKNLLKEFTLKLDHATFHRPDHYVPNWLKLCARYIKHYF